jgi:dCTP deaminase
MLLSDSEIVSGVENGRIVIRPFSLDCVGSNSYDVHLSKNLLVYKGFLDAKKKPETHSIIIPDSGFVLEPNRLYLGSTIEYTENPVYLPFLEGKSSVGRLGIQVHLTAGKGDVGFNNHWTLEIACVQPVRVYAGMPIAQLIFHRVEGEVRVPYSQKVNAKYTDVSEYPQPSRMYLNFQYKL